MYCPLMSYRAGTGFGLVEDNDTHFGVEECLKEKCAWWDGVARKCAVLVIAINCLGE